MTLRSIIYWALCCAFAALATHASEPGVIQDIISFEVPQNISRQLLPAPEPSRAILLFAGIMAMAFTYRRAWMNWQK